MGLGAHCAPMRSLSDICDPKPRGLSAIWSVTVKWSGRTAVVISLALAVVFAFVFVFALATGHGVKDSFGLAMISTEYVAVSPLFLIATGHLPQIEI
jgi:hypothetical protein